jgi:hypothetical protein
MHEFIGAMVAGTVITQVLFWTLVSVVAPIFWVWMLIDAVLREEREYASGSSSEKLIWVLVMFFFNVTALAYYLVVYRKIRRGSVPVGYAGVPAGYTVAAPAA